MSYDYVNYRRRQYDLPQPAQPFRPYQPVQPRRATCWDPPDRRPTCWDPPGNRPLPSFQPYDPPQSRQPSCWEPPPRRASRGYSDYYQPPLGPPSRWDPPGQRIDRCHPPPPYVGPDSDLQPRTSYARNRSWQPQFQPGPATTTKDSINAKLDRLLEALDRMDTRVVAADRRVSKSRSSQQPPYRPPRSTTRWESPEYVPPIPLGCPPPHAAESRRLSRPYLRHDPSSPSLPAVAAVPPPPPQRSSSCLSMTSTCRSAAPLPAVAAVPSTNLPPSAPSCRPDDDGGEESRLLDEPASPADSGEEETLLDDDEEVDSIEEVKMVVASIDAARMTSQDVVENCLHENGGALLRKFSKAENGGIYLCALVGNKVAHSFTIRLKEIAFICADLYVGDVTSMNPRLPLLDADARFIPPRNDTPCLSSHGCVAELFMLALNCHDNNVAWVSAMSHIQHFSLLVILDGNDEGRRSTLRCAFDPGGDSSPTLLHVMLFVVSWFPP